MSTRICRTCKKEKLLKEFHFTFRYNKSTYLYDCKVCHNEKGRAYSKNNRQRKNAWAKDYHERKPQIRRKCKLKKLYGLSLDDYDAMFIAQNSRCKICKKKESEITFNGSKWAIDHCHKTGKVRGILCRACNSGLGYFRDNIDFLNSAIEFLKENNEKEVQSIGTTIYCT